MSNIFENKNIINEKLIKWCNDNNLNIYTFDKFTYMACGKGNSNAKEVYSAFLIMNVNDDLETINKQLCNDTYDNFKILHDEEINRLKKLKANGYKLISSMGI